MKVYVALFVLLIVLVQLYSTYAELSGSSLNSDDGERLSKRNIRSAWEKRLSKAWGKRSEGDSDELYQRILRELYHSARLHQLSHPRYSADSDSDPLTLERLIAQRTTWNNDNENAAENNS